jgi:hypothetical protein
VAQYSFVLLFKVTTNWFTLLLLVKVNCGQVLANGLDYSSSKGEDAESHKQPTGQHHHGTGVEVMTGVATFTIQHKNGTATAIRINVR